MINYKIIKRLKMIIGIIVVVVFFTMGYLLGDGIRYNEMKKTTLEQVSSNSQTIKLDATTTTVNHELSSKAVKDFLIAYYTKTELEENRNRYKPFLTEGMYNVIVNEEEKPINQAYKGYIVDQVFQDANIYIDKDKNEVLVSVKYAYTLLAHKDRRDVSTQKNAIETLKLSYTNNGNTWLINNIERMTLEKSTITNLLGQSSTVRDEYSSNTQTTSVTTTEITETTQSPKIGE